MNKMIIAQGCVAVLIVLASAGIFSKDPSTRLSPEADDIYSYHDQCREASEKIGYTYEHAEEIIRFWGNIDVNCYALDREGVVRQLY